ncbi:hypothetical protein BDZ90DRAFT_232117 [Jaminaea rosea]|uniref:Uncharacterized protein n=1 Tax=Jaminaea rosea TaxID=1569628 RepID=A0A316UUX1_9BASI|nr:hypothetical protein BDZ90DRAFT_232117 [Jaminaea rosea]PWN27713.1 hypothetical protein BDZ90DRAFT_232117 [Jaminaea rosea]
MIARTPATTFRAVSSLRQAPSSVAQRWQSTATTRPATPLRLANALPRARAAATTTSFSGRPGFSAAASFSTSTPSFKSAQDKEHPQSLWYHSLSNGKYAVTYSSTPPPSAEHPSVIASFNADEKVDPIAHARENPDDVHANGPFWDLLHKTLKEDVVAKGKDPILQQEADLREEGWAHLGDGRHQTMPGRIPTPDAIIASVSFTGGKLAPESYTVNGTHRAVTKEEGFVVLRDTWFEAIKAALSKAK